MLTNTPQCISFRDNDNEAMSERINDWLDSENTDIEIISCNFTAVTVGDWTAPDGEDVIFSALIFYRYITKDK